MTTPDPIIVSIPHTGTRFLKDRLGIEEHVHTNANWVRILERVNGKRIVSPLRSPYQVWRSWCRRRDEPSINNWVGHFFASFYQMHALDQMFDIDFVCVDKREDERIEDWSRVGDGDPDHVKWKLHRVDLRVLYKIPFVNEHYASWRE